MVCYSMSGMDLYCITSRCLEGTESYYDIYNLTYIILLLLLMVPNLISRRDAHCSIYFLNCRQDMNALMIFPVKRQNA